MRVLQLMAVWSLAGMLAACGGKPPSDNVGGGAQPPAGRVVNVCNWPDYIAPGLIEQFTAETGIEIKYDTYDGNSMLETKLLTGLSGCDVVVPTANFLQRQVAARSTRRLTARAWKTTATSIPT